MSSSCMRVGPESNDRCPCKSQKRDTDTEKPCEGGGRDGREAATSPGMPGAPEAGRGRKDPPLAASRESVILPPWISVVLPLLDLSSSVLPGSQWPCPAWISAALPCLGLRGPVLPGSLWSCPSWVSVVLPLLDLGGPAPPGSQQPCPAWISAVLPCLGLHSPVLPGSQQSWSPGWRENTVLLSKVPPLGRRQP